MDSNTKLKIVLQTVFQTDDVEKLLECDIERLKDLIERVTIVDNRDIYLQGDVLIRRRT